MKFISNDSFIVYSHKYKFEDYPYDFPLISGHILLEDYILLITNFNTIDFNNVEFFIKTLNLNDCICAKIDNIFTYYFTENLINNISLEDTKLKYFTRLNRWNNNRDDVVFVFNSFSSEYETITLSDIDRIKNINTSLCLLIVIDNIHDHNVYENTDRILYLRANNISPEWYIHIYNYYYRYGNRIPNIIHLCGKTQDNYKMLSQRLLNSADLTNYLKNEYDILSCWTNDEECILLLLLSKANIPLINAIPDDYDYTSHWYMPNKIRFIIDALKNKCTNDVVLILDGYDVLFNSFENIREKFVKTGYKILYNSTKYNYPKVDIGLVDNIKTDWRYFNAGCCIGYRYDLIKFYKEALKYIDIPNEWNSEQYIIRHAFENHKCKDIMFETDPNIFITMGLTTTYSTEYNNIFRIESTGYLDLSGTRIYIMEKGLTKESIEGKIPLVDFVVCTFNFDMIDKNYSYENYNYSIKMEGDHLSVNFKNSIPCPIYLYVDSHETYYFAFDEELLYNYLKCVCNYRLINEGTFNMVGDFPSDVCVQTHNHLNLYCIKNYENMKIYKKDITFEYINDYYTVPIKDAGYIIKGWIQKYKNLISSIPENILIPDLSAGLDTRSLTYFWRDNPNIKNITIYTKLTEDGETIELPIVKQIVQYIHDKYDKNISIIHEHSEEDNYIVLSGKGGDVWAVPARFRSRCFLDGFLSIKVGTKYLTHIYPYLDRDLLKIKADYPGQLKDIMQYLLANEFIGKIDYFSFKREKYEFDEKIEYESKEMIRQWGFDI